MSTGDLAGSRTSMRRAARHSHDRLSAVDRQILAGDMPAAVAGEKDDERRLIRRLGEPAEGDAEAPLIGLAADDRVDVSPGLDVDEHLGRGRAGGDRVDGYAVRGELESEAADGLDQRGLRGRVGGVVETDDVAADDRGDQDDAAAVPLPDELPCAGLREEERAAGVHA